MKTLLISFCLILLVLSCETPPPSAQEIVDSSIVAHGMEQFNGSKVSFDFRKKNYSILRNGGRYVYTSRKDSMEDRLDSSGRFDRKVGGQKITLPDSLEFSFSESLNSVAYFFQLPYLLNDKAVIKTFKGKTTLLDKEYYWLEVRFQEEEGGQDFQDVFLYWFDIKTYTMDYLAYKYHTSGGGMRFREATNRRNSKGLVVQDYINYSPKKGTKLSLYELADYFEQKQLTRVSEIEKKNITLHPQNKNDILWE